MHTDVGQEEEEGKGQVGERIWGDDEGSKPVVPGDKGERGRVGGHRALLGRGYNGITHAGSHTQRERARARERKRERARERAHVRERERERERERDSNTPGYGGRV